MPHVCRGAILGHSRGPIVQRVFFRELFTFRISQLHGLPNWYLPISVCLPP